MGRKKESRSRSTYLDRQDLEGTLLDLVQAVACTSFAEDGLAESLADSLESHEGCHTHWVPVEAYHCLVAGTFGLGQERTSSGESSDRVRHLAVQPSCGHLVAERRTGLETLDGRTLAGRLQLLGNLGEGRMRSAVELAH
jgi:hypothetical protein